MRKRCSECGKFMKIDDLVFFDDEEFDEELAIACGYTEEQIENLSPFDEPLNRFIYVQDCWTCSGEDCSNTECYTEGPKYYYNPDTNNYDGPKPLTLKEQAEIERLKQEAAGQLRLDL